MPRIIIHFLMNHNDETIEISDFESASLIQSVSSLNLILSENGTKK